MTKCLVKNSEGECINLVQERGQYYIQNNSDGAVLTIGLSSGDIREFVKNVAKISIEEDV